MYSTPRMVNIFMLALSIACAIFAVVVTTLLVVADRDYVPAALCLVLFAGFAVFFAIMHFKLRRTNHA